MKSFMTKKILSYDIVFYVIISTFKLIIMTFYLIIYTFFFVIIMIYKSSEAGLPQLCSVTDPE